MHGVRDRLRVQGLAARPGLKGSVGEGPNHSNFSDRSSVRIRSKFRNFILARAKRERVVQDEVEKANRRPTDRHEPTDTASLTASLKIDNF